MYYPGDQYIFILSLAAHSSVETPPQISVLNASTGDPVDLGGVSTAAMSLIPGTDKIYKYVWSTVGLTDGQFIGVASYVADSQAVSGRLIEVVQLGDTRVSGPVALNSTVAKDATVAKHATVMKVTDFVAPANDASIIAIKAKTDALPSLVAAQASVDALTSKVDDLHDEALGTWEINKTANPKTLTLRRKNGTILQVFNLTNIDSAAARTRA